MTDLDCLIVPPPPFQHLKNIDGGHFLHPKGTLSFTSTLARRVLDSVLFSIRGLQRQPPAETRRCPDLPPARHSRGHLLQRFAGHAIASFRVVGWLVRDLNFSLTPFSPHGSARYAGRGSFSFTCSREQEVGFWSAAGTETRKHFQLQGNADP